MTTSATFPALGSTAVLAVADERALAAACPVVQETIDDFDLACSRFRSDSELTALNAAAGTGPVVVGPLLLAAIQAALRAARITGGAVDPTVGSALVALGYDRDYQAIASAPDFEVRSVPRWPTVSVPGWRTVSVDQDTVALSPGVMLDLGATAKALCADDAAARAHEACGTGVLVSLGGDIATAGPAPADGWRVRVTDDHSAGVDAPGQWISIRSGGLATSSTTVRRWRAGAEDANHLIDPATGSPVDGRWRTASVTAATCVDANTASTAAIVLGQRALAWLEGLRLPSRLVGVDGSVAHVAGWPSVGDDLAGAVEAASA